MACSGCRTGRFVPHCLPYPLAILGPCCGLLPPIQVTCGLFQDTLMPVQGSRPPRRKQSQSNDAATPAGPQYFRGLDGVLKAHRITQGF